MKREARKKSHLLPISLLLLLLSLLALGSATFAWFTFNNSTRVEPMAGSVGDGDVSLLISDSATGPFDKECQLPLVNNTQELQPLSTADLKKFYAAAAQNRQGITLSYRDVTDTAEKCMLHGTVYLQSKNRSCDVYFFAPQLNFGTDGQVLSSLRLALRIQSRTDGEKTRFFRLDDLGGAGAETRATVSEDNVVVSSANAAGAPVYVADPAENISAYLAQADGETDTKPRAGQQRLCALEADEVASVEFWLYLEGCDPNCFNSVQTRDLSLQLAFAGVAGEQQDE